MRSPTRKTAENLRQFWVNIFLNVIPSRKVSPIPVCWTVIPMLSAVIFIKMFLSNCYLMLYIHKLSFSPHVFTSIWGIFPGLSQIFTKKQSWNSRYADFFRMNIKILTTRVLKKWSELKKVTWKIVQLNLKSNSILLISRLLNYRFSKVRPFLESME